jgi:hypothetical protein
MAAMLICPHKIDLLKWQQDKDLRKTRVIFSPKWVKIEVEYLAR